MTGTVVQDLVFFCLKHCRSNAGLNPLHLSLESPGDPSHPGTGWHPYTAHLLSPTAFKFLVFQRKLLRYGTENWRQRHCNSLLNVLCGHSKPSELLLSKKPMQVKCSPWIIWVSVHHWPGVSIHSAGNRILYGIIWSASLTRKRFALFSGLDLGNGLLGFFKCFEVFMSSKTYQA